MSHHSMPFRSLPEFVQLVTSRQVFHSTIPTEMGDGIGDLFFVSCLSQYEDKSYAEIYYLLANAFTRLALKTNRIKLTKQLFEHSITIMNHYEGGDEYIGSMTKELISVAISTERVALIDWIIKKESAICDTDWMGVEHLTAARMRGKHKGIEITRLLSKKANERELTINLVIAIENDAIWQAKVLFLCGARLDNLSESNIRKIVGSPKAAIISLAEKQDHALTYLFKRYITKCKADPIDYLSICPEWQKPYIMDIVSEL